jgi:hypothetical protein
MEEKCEICGGAKRPVMFSHSAGWAPHDGNECLMELRRRIEALEKRYVFSEVAGPVKIAPDGVLVKSDNAGPSQEKSGENDLSSEGDYVCGLCKDTHLVPAGDYYGACPECPSPCDKCCRAVVIGRPFCNHTPCACECHTARPRPEE